MRWGVGVARHRSLIMGLMLAVGPLALAACGEEAAPSQACRPAVSGERLTLQPSRAVDWKDVSATITSVDMADARARIPGILQSLSVREGDYVRAGQVIGRVVDSRLGYESAAYGAQAAAAQAQAAQAEAELARVRYLHAKGVYARARLEQAEAAARAAQAQVSAARAQQSAVGAVAGQGTITAPSSGRVLIAPVPAGSAVAPGVSVATITSGPMILRLDLPETLAGEVRVGSRVIATGLAAVGSAAAAPAANVTLVYPAVQGGQLQADVAMPGLDNAMVGRRIAARVAVGERMALIVPRRFVISRYGLDYVSIAQANNSIAQVPVQIAPTADGDAVEILSGAARGDVLIAPAAAAPATPAGAARR